MKILLSPAGNSQAFYSAISSGADAVYLGLNDFNARRNADNFTTDNIGEYIKYAHLFGVRIYITLNILIKNDELESFFATADEAYRAGADAFIVQDVMLGEILRQRYPHIELHLSTQAGVCNVYGARVAVEKGFDRVVLARETTMADIKAISKIVSTEVFVQGALCSSFSGQCYLSSFVGGNSGNRGLCKQPCRQKYSLNGEKECYAISLADLCVGKKIKDFVEAGVTAFKIEGRMRRPSYVAMATKYYRDILDGKTPDMSNLRKCFNRGDYTTGLAYGQSEGFISNKTQSHIGEYIGNVSRISKGEITINSKYIPNVGDSMKILRNGYEVGNAIVERIDKNFVASYKGQVKVGDKINITTDMRLEQAIERKTLPVDVMATIYAGSNIKLVATCMGVTVSVEGDFDVQESVNRPLSDKDVRECLEKVDTLPFYLQNVTVYTANAFVPKSQFNGLRRELYQKLYDSLTVNKPRKIVDKKCECKQYQTEKDREIAIICDRIDFDICKVTQIIISPDDYSDVAMVKSLVDKCGDKQKYLYIPPFTSGRDVEIIGKIVELFDGIYIENLGGIELGKLWGKKIFVGSGMHSFNKIDLANMTEYDKVCLSCELSVRECSELSNWAKHRPYTYSYGNLVAMNFVYCPFGGNCAKCKGKDWSTLYDGQRTFPLRRIKLSQCRFQLYNCNILVGLPSSKTLVNGVGMTKDQIEIILDNIDNPNLIKKHITDYTTGHSQKAVL